jgi:DNA-binding response OmpR family regulator
MPHILIVDDGSPMTSWLIEALMEERYKVEVALDYKDTLTLYDRFRHDLIVADVGATERRDMVTGLLQQYRDALVLALVGDESVEYNSALDAAITFGSVRILRKPFSSSFFVQAVKEQLS